MVGRTPSSTPCTSIPDSSASFLKLLSPVSNGHFNCRDFQKTDLSVIPEDVKAAAMEKMQGLKFTEAEINAELAVIAKDYAPETKSK